MDFWPLYRINPAKRLDDTDAPVLTFDRRKTADILIEKIPFLLVAVISAAVIVFFSYQRETITSTRTLPLMLRISNAIVSYVTYLFKMVWPTNLGISYPYPESVPVLHVAGALILLSGISFVVIKFLKTLISPVPA